MDYVSKKFKFRNSSDARSAAIVFNLIILAIAVIATYRSTPLGGLLVVLIGGPFFWIVQAYVVFNTLDVLIDDDGLKRLFRGKVLFFINWKDVYKIAYSTSFITPYNGGKSKEMIYLNIWPTVESRPIFRISLSGKMMFTSELAEFDEFFKAVKEKAKIYNLLIEYN